MLPPLVADCGMNEKELASQTEESLTNSREEIQCDSFLRTPSSFRAFHILHHSSSAYTFFVGGGTFIHRLERGFV